MRASCVCKYLWKKKDIDLVFLPLAKIEIGILIQLTKTS